MNSFIEAYAIRRTALYCVKCGLVVFVERDKNENLKLPPNFPMGKCRICFHELIPVDKNESIQIFTQIANKVKSEYNIDNLNSISGAILDDYREIIKQKYVFTNNDFDIDSFQKHLKGNPITTYENAIDYLDRQKRGIPTYEPKIVSSSSVHCPRCGSTSISTQKKGFGVGKAAAGAVAGAVVAGPIGLAGAAAGAAGANKVFNVCQKCGHRWEPGK